MASTMSGIRVHERNSNFIAYNQMESIDNGHLGDVILEKLSRRFN